MNYNLQLIPKKMLNFHCNFDKHIFGFEFNFNNTGFGQYYVIYHIPTYRYETASI